MSRLQWIPMLVLFGLFVVTTVMLQNSGDSEQTELLARIETRLDGLSDRVDEVDASVTDLGARVAGVERRAAESRDAVARLERETEALSENRPALAAGAGDAERESSRERSPASVERDMDDFRRLLDGVLGDGDDVSAEDQERFWKLARDGETLDRIIDDLESAISDDPGDIDARMELADTYVAKLLTVPSGPERGVWGSKAENQWKSVAEGNEDHWESRFKMGNSLSYYPRFLNRTQEAIDWLEQGVKLLDREPVEDRHTENYVRLAGLYQREGDTEKARTTLEAGLTRHPGDETMTQMADNLEKSQ